ncbi:MAG: HlyD family efflux transporter periplasmic adaptor subunit, partial [Psychrobacter alimentarius]
RVEGLQVKAEDQLAARTPLLQLNDETQLHFVSLLPIQVKPQLSIGQTVNFSVNGQSDNFTGQISKLTTTSQPKKLLVHVDVIENKASRATLLPNMKVIGRVDYGQIDVGTIVPKRALHDVDLTELQKPPYKPLRPLTANVWIIGQDQRLMRRPIEVVEYNPTTKQYLIAGISNDSLICLADLPVDSNGKKVIVS